MTNSNQWKEYRLDEIALIQGGGTPRRSETAYFGGSIPWVTPTDLPAIGLVTELNGTKETITDAGLANSSAKLIEPGSVLFSSRASVGKIAVTNVPCATNQGFANFTPRREVVDCWFLACLLCRYTSEIITLAGRTTFLEVPRKKLKAFKAALPPLAEQRRIVARIKECMERVEEVEGLRADAIEEAKGIYPSRCHDFFSKHDSENEWHKTTIGELSLSIQYGYTQSATKSPVGPRFLRITDIQNHSVDWESVPYCEADTKVIEKYKLKEGDILFARTGATTGKSFLIENTPPLAVFASYLIRLQIDKERVLPRLVYHFFQSPAYWDQVRRNMRGGAQPNINSKVLSSLSVTIPSSPDEQRMVVKQLDHAFELSLGLSVVVSDQTKSIGFLRDSILRKAFAGEL